MVSKLSSILGEPMLLASGFESGSDMAKKMEEKFHERKYEILHYTGSAEKDG
ncbi:MAG: hypothetical protein QM793_12315 [Muricomes sp.]